MHSPRARSNNYAKIVVPGSPITKSNFKLHNKDGRAILPSNTGMAHDKFALYEEQIAYYARSQNPDTVFTESLIAVLKVYYKSEKRHPDTANITKSIFDGIEKSGLIVNDAQITRIITEEFYDKENPRFELEFFAESRYEISYSIKEKEKPSEKKPKNVEILSTKIYSHCNEIKIVMTADVVYTGRVWQDQFINLGINLTHDNDLEINNYDNISKNFVEKEHHPNKPIKLEFTKVFSVKDFKDNHFEIYLKPTDKDYLWNPEHSVTLKNINVKI